MILKVHAEPYVRFLQGAHAEFIAAGRAGRGLPGGGRFVACAATGAKELRCAHGYVFVRFRLSADGRYVANDACWRRCRRLTGVDLINAGERSCILC